MKFRNLHMSGFLSYEDGDIDMSDLAYTAIVGANGAGKSTIPHAIVWVLFGAYRVSGDADSVINTFYDDCIVSLEFSTRDDDLWRVTRSKRRGKSAKLKLEYMDSDEGWVRFGDHTNASAQSQIINLIGMSEQSWRSLVLMSNEDGGNRFVAADPRERREIITELVPEAARWSEFLSKVTDEKRSLDSKIASAEAVIESAEQSIEDAKARLNDAQEEAASFDEDEAKNKIDQLNAELAAAGTDSQYQVLQTKISQIKSERKSIEREHAANLRALKGELADIEKARRELTIAKKEVGKIEAETQDISEELESLIEKVDDIDADVVDANDNLTTISDRLSAAVSRQSAAKSALDDAHKRQHAIEDNGAGVCYVCRSEIDDDRYDEIIDANNGEIERAQTDLDLANRAVSKAQADHKRAKAAYDAANKLKLSTHKSISSLKSSLASGNTRIQSELSRIQSIEAEIEEMRDADDIQSDIDNLVEAHEAKLSSIDKELEETEDALDDIETVDTREIKRKIAAIEAQIKKHSEVIGSIKSYKATIKDQKKRLKDSKNDIEEMKSRRDDIGFIYEASKSSGIPAMLIDGVLSEIEAEQNNILANLPGSENMVVEFRTEKALKNGSSRSSLDIVVHDGTGSERLFESFSSGERVRLTVSNMFAMAKVFGARHPGATGTIILDEPLGVLDIDVVPAFVDVLRSAINSGIADSILVVTHDQQVIDALPQKVLVHKTADRGSVIEVI